MGAMIKIGRDAAMRVMEMRQRRAEESEEMAVHNYLLLSARLNKMTSELVKTRQQNAELLRVIDSMSGYPQRLLLPGSR